MPLLDTVAFWHARSLCSDRSFCNDMRVPCCSIFVLPFFCLHCFFTNSGKKSGKESLNDEKDKKFKTGMQTVSDSSKSIYIHRYSDKFGDNTSKDITFKIRNWPFRD